MVRPNFLYVGTSKAGSTWLFNILSLHPEVYLPSNKGLYYFDSHFDMGRDGYLAHFRGAGDAHAVGEISHSYLSSPEAPERIAALNPDMHLLVCLREPVDRAFSDYLDLQKNGLFNGSFEEALERYPSLIERGRYATHLERYLQFFPREQLHIGLFDELKADPQSYADSVFDFLGIGTLTLPRTALERRMPAGTPRNAHVAAAAKLASTIAKKVGLRRLRSRVKRSTTIRQLVYRPYGDDRPTIEPEVAASLRKVFTPEIMRLDGLLVVGLAALWDYVPI
jgi:Sulfotransferase domain